MGWRRQLNYVATDWLGHELTLPRPTQHYQRLWQVSLSRAGSGNQEEKGGLLIGEDMSGQRIPPPKRSDPMNTTQFLWHELGATMAVPPSMAESPSRKTLGERGRGLGSGACLQ